MDRAPEALRQALDEAELEHAVHVYRIFHPTVCGAALFGGTEEVALTDREIGSVTRPRHIIFTATSDTPYALLPLDLSSGPVVVEVPAGPLLAAAVDAEQRWIADMGIAGPDAGRGGAHLILPPDFTGLIPERPHVWTSGTRRVMVGVRALSVRGDIKGAIDRIRAIEVRALSHVADWPEPGWVDTSEKGAGVTPRAWEASLKFWEVLHEVIESEPPRPGTLGDHAELAGLGIVAGQRFAPDARRRRILEEAARRGKSLR
jgi:hypothetical protein